MNQIGLDFEDAMGTSLGPFMVSHMKKPVGSLVDNPLTKMKDVEMMGPGCGL